MLLYSLGLHVSSILKSKNVNNGFINDRTYSPKQRAVQWISKTCGYIALRIILLVDKPLFSYRHVSCHWQTWVIANDKCWSFLLRTSVSKYLVMHVRMWAHLWFWEVAEPFKLDTTYYSSIGRKVNQSTKTIVYTLFNGLYKLTWARSQTFYRF